MRAVARTLLLLFGVGVVALNYPDAESQGTFTPSKLEWSIDRNVGASAQQTGPDGLRTWSPPPQPFNGPKSPRARPWP